MLDERINDDEVEAIDPPSTDGGGGSALESVDGEATLIDPPATDGGGGGN